MKTCENKQMKYILLNPVQNIMALNTWLDHNWDFVSTCIQAILEHKWMKIIENKQMQYILLNPVQSIINMNLKIQ